jgi:hypothetical protein
MTPTTLVVILGLLQRTVAPSLSGGLGAEHAAFSLIGLVAVLICAGPTPPPETKPAVVEIGRERGSAETASQRAGAALSWNTLEGGRGVLDSFRRLGTGSGCSWTASKGQ